MIDDSLRISLVFIVITIFAALSFFILKDVGAQALRICKISHDEQQILWLARTIYSETKQKNEMNLVAWTIRNRVDTEYRGDDTYKEVVTRAHQFSALHPRSDHYERITSLSYADTNPVWQEALSVARDVYYAPESTRPFPVSVRHFYSPVSVQNTPAWTEHGRVHTVSHGERGAPARFTFYAGVK